MGARVATRALPARAAAESAAAAVGFIVVNDLHARAADDAPFLTDLVAGMTKTIAAAPHVKACFVLGDLTHDGTP